jgi:mRNA interferase MazF
MDRPPRKEVRIKSAPKIREFFWCDFWADAQLPEMWKTRPVLILSFKNRLFGTCTVIPLSTDPENANDPWAVESPRELGADRKSWLICNQPCSVATSRLTSFKVTPRLSELEFNPVLAKVLEWLPKVPGT